MQDFQGSNSNSEKLLDSINSENSVVGKLYLSRFYILAVFSLFGFMQGLCWAIPGPLSSAYSTLYSVDNDLVQLYVNLGPIVYIPLSLPFSFWMDSPNGVRRSVVFSITLVFLGQVLRTLASDASAQSRRLLEASYILNAAAGPVAMGAVGKLSEAWFPPTQRATATAVMAEANVLGVAAAMLAGPLIVSGPTMSQMQVYNWGLLGLCALMQVCAMCYFPGHPPTPPSNSASQGEAKEQRFSLTALRDTAYFTLTSRNFIVLAGAYGLCTGMFGSWATVLSINLSGCDARTVGWLSFSMTVVGGVGGIVVGLAADKFRHLKASLVGLIAASALCFLAFALLCSGAFSGFTICHQDGSPGPGMVPLFALSILGGLFVNASIPLFLELSLEISYPRPEATVFIMLTNVNNLGCLIFLSIPNTWFVFCGRPLCCAYRS